MTRFSLWALAAVVVAAVVLAALGWISLRQWERSAELAFREQARDMVAMAAEKFEMVLHAVPPDVLARLRDAATTGDLRALEAVLAEPACREALEKTLGGGGAPTFFGRRDPRGGVVSARESIDAAQRVPSARLGAALSGVDRFA